MLTVFRQMECGLQRREKCSDSSGRICRTRQMQLAGLGRSEALPGKLNEVF
jgi:hypothetical protein